MVLETGEHKDADLREDYSLERVEYLCDRSLFKGKVYKPANLEKCKGVVIFTHGLGYCDRRCGPDDRV